jgi:hypothetical protein
MMKDSLDREEVWPALRVINVERILFRGAEARDHVRGQTEPLGSRPRVREIGRDPSDRQVRKTSAFGSSSKMRVRVETGTPV